MSEGMMTLEELKAATHFDYRTRRGFGIGQDFFWGNQIDCSKAVFANNTKRDHEESCLEDIRSKGFKPNRPAPAGPVYGRHDSYPAIPPGDGLF